MLLVCCCLCCMFVLPVMAVLCCIIGKDHRSDPFAKLVPKERWAVLRHIMKQELKHLKIERPIKLVASDELTKGVQGAYYPGLGVVAINKRLLTTKCPDSTQLVAVLTHELWHVKDFQDLLGVDYQAYASMTIEQQNVFKQLAQDVVTYKSSHEEGYSAQLIEQRAEAYAKGRVEFYRIRLPDIITEKGINL